MVLVGASSLTLVESDNDHGFSLVTDLLWLRLEGHKLDIVADSNNLPSSLSFDVLLCDILGLVVKEPMRIPRPGDTPHIDFKAMLDVVGVSSGSYVLSWSLHRMLSLRLLSRNQGIRGNIERDVGLHG